MLLDNIRKIGKEQHKSLTQLEVDAGLGKKTIARWNDIDPSVHKVKRVADCLNKTVDELLRDD